MFIYRELIFVLKTTEHPKIPLWGSGLRAWWGWEEGTGSDWAPVPVSQRSSLHAMRLGTLAVEKCMEGG